MNPEGDEQGIKNKELRIKNKEVGSPQTPHLNPTPHHEDPIRIREETGTGRIA